MALNRLECETIVCDIANGFIQKNEIPLPQEVTDYIQTVLSNKEGANNG